MSDLTDKRYQRKHSSLLESYLDNDTVLKVIEHLDSYSIINFLHAFPRFKNLAVIVTDHHKPQPLFFRIDGVERVHITDYTETQPVEIMEYGNPDYRTLAKSTVKAQRFSTSRPIRLFEFAWMETEEYAESILPVIPSQERLSRDQPFYFNATSFVFLCPNYYRDIRPMDALTRRLDEFTQAKWHVGCSPYFNEDCVIVNSFDFLYHADVEIDLITNLCLKDVPVVANLHLPELQRLSLIYHDTRAPVVKGIVAPKLTKFIVHYNHQVPQFSEMSVATEEQDSEYDEERKFLLRDNFYTPHNFYYGPDFEAIDDLRVFELAQIGSMAKGTRPAVSSTGGDAFGDFSFVKEFQVLHLFGVPGSFFRSADLSNMCKLRWDIVDQPQIMEAPIVAPILSNLSLVVRHDGIRLPSFSMKGKVYRRSSQWHIMILGLNTNTSDLWNSDLDREWFACEGLCIYNSPRLVFRDPLSVLELGYDDWICVSALMSRGYRSYWDPSIVETVELIGFKMPFLSRPPGQAFSEGRCWGSFRTKKLIIRPVIDIQSEGEQLKLSALFLSKGMREAMLYASGIHLKVNPNANIKNLELVISPVLLNLDTGVPRKRVEVCYPHHIGRLLTGMRHEVSRTLSISLGTGVSSLCLLNANVMPSLVLNPELPDKDVGTISIDLDIIEPDTPLVGRLRRGRDMECDWFFYAE